MSTKYRLLTIFFLYLLLLGCRQSPHAAGTDPPPPEANTSASPPSATLTVAPTTIPPAAPFTALPREAWTNLSVDELHEQLFAAMLARDPQYATELGLAAHYGLGQHRLTDLSDAYAAETAALWLELLQRLQELDPAGLTPEQQRSNAILIWDLQDRLSLVPFRDHIYPVHQLFSVPSSFPEFMTGAHPLDCPQDALDYLARLAAVETQFAQLQSLLEKRAALGLLPPRFVFDRVRPQLEAIIAPPIPEQPLYTSFADRLALLELPFTEENALLDEAARTLTDSVYPAYESLLTTLNDIQPAAPTTIGAGDMPSGAEYYAAMLTHHNTTTLTAAEIHELGLQEVARLTAEQTALLAEMGFAADISTGIGQVYNNAGGIQITDQAARERVFAAYAEVIARAEEELAPLFPLWPEAELHIEPVPAFREATAPGAYYYSPPLDGSRPGLFFINAPIGSFVSYVGIPTLAYHEGIPGHHFQKAIQRERVALPTFRRVATFSAYAEGWALYVEKLAWEEGLYAGDPFGNYGRLQSELFRAARLVVDTGIHARGWSREEAIDYMMETLGWGPGAVTAEVERYIVWPGQATSYKIGELTILRLREEAAAALGANFDLAAFHVLILQNGDVPLPILEQIVADWIAAQ